jgi:hypothetical protein
VETADIPETGPTDWRAEPDAERHASILKLAEECNELAARLCRAAMQGIDARDPETGRRNRDHIQDEVADVEAMLWNLQERIPLDRDALYERKTRKMLFKAPWFDALHGKKTGERGK